MHDLDRTLREFETGIDALESADYEYEGEGGFGYGDGEMGEVEEMEFAAGLLEVSDEQELEQFFGNLFKTVVSGARSFAGTPAGKALVGVLKNAAAKALPTLGGTIGERIGGGAGRQFGQQAGQWAADQLGGELEQDREFETAQAIVRVATAAAQQLAQSSNGGPPAAAARQAAIAAAQQLAPQLTRAFAYAGAAPFQSGAASRAGRSGRWVRKGNRIILYGV